MNGLPPYAIVLLALLALGMAVLLIVWLVRYVTGSGARQASGLESIPVPAESNPDAAPPFDQEHVLCVSRKRDGGVAITVQGEPYNRLRDIKDPAVGRFAVEAVKGVLLFAEELLPSAVRRSLRPTRKPTRAMADEGVQALAGEKAQASPRQLVDQIDELVQARLKDRPDLADRGIRLREGSGGGLVIFVGQERYESVDKVTDKGVQRLIREAIREWEGR